VSRGGGGGGRRNGGRVNYYARRPTAERLNWIRPNCLDPPPTAAANAGVHEPTSTTGLRYENVSPTMIYERRRTTRMQKTKQPTDETGSSLHTGRYILAVAEMQTKPFSQT